MARIVFGSIDELISLTLDDKTFRNLIKRMQDTRKARVGGWYEEFRKLRGLLLGHLSRQFFFMPLPDLANKQPRAVFAVHYKADIGQGQKADSWDFALVPNGKDMSPEAVREWIKKAIDGVYGPGFFQEQIVEIVPVSTTEPIYKKQEVVQKEAGEEEADPFANPDG